MRQDLKIKDQLVTGEDFMVSEHMDGVLVTKPVLSEKDLFKYYDSSKYISHNKGRGLFNGLFEFFSKWMLRKKFNMIKPYVKQNSLVADFGCGTGKFLSYVSKKGLNAVGVENNPTAIKSCRLKKLKTYKSLNDIKQNINLISFWHSFEHVSNYNEILTQSNKLLVKDGFVLIAVPNFMSYDANHYKDMWAAYDVPRHRYHFSPAGLKSVMDNAGFDFIKKHPLLLDSYYISMLSEKYKKSKLFFLKGLIVGFVSNFSAIFTSNYSSSAFVFKKRE